MPIDSEILESLKSNSTHLTTLTLHHLEVKVDELLELCHLIEKHVYLKRIKIISLSITALHIAAFLNSKSVNSLSFHDCEISEEIISLIARSNKIKYLFLKGNFAAKDIMDLYNNKSIKKLALISDRLSIVGVNLISRNIALNKLTLASPLLPDASLEAIAKLPKLYELHITSPKITDQGLSYLTKSLNLRSLTINSANVVGSGIALLKAHPGISSLSITSQSVKDEIWGHLANISNLKCLTLECQNLAVQEIASLLTHDGLASLTIHNNQITDSELGQLAKMPNLRELNIKSNSISNAGLIPIIKQGKIDKFCVHADGSKLIDFESVEAAAKSSALDSASITSAQIASFDYGVLNRVGERNKLLKFLQTALTLSSEIRHEESLFSLISQDLFSLILEYIWGNSYIDSCSVSSFGNALYQSNKTSNDTQLIFLNRVTDKWVGLLQSPTANQMVFVKKLKRLGFLLENKREFTDGSLLMLMDYAIMKGNEELFNFIANYYNKALGCYIVPTDSLLSLLSLVLNESHQDALYIVIRQYFKTVYKHIVKRGVFDLPNELRKVKAILKQILPEYKSGQVIKLAEGVQRNRLQNDSRQLLDQLFEGLLNDKKKLNSEILSEKMKEGYKQLILDLRYDRPFLRKKICQRILEIDDAYVLMALKDYFQNDNICELIRRRERNFGLSFFGYYMETGNVKHGFFGKSYPETKDVSRSYSDIMQAIKLRLAQLATQEAAKTPSGKSILMNQLLDENHSMGKFINTQRYRNLKFWQNDTRTRQILLTPDANKREQKLGEAITSFKRSNHMF